MCLDIAKGNSAARFALHYFRFQVGTHDLIMARRLGRRRMRHSRVQNQAYRLPLCLD